ncbi:MAG: hypothetical protein JXA67_18755 [Micromonosporaceae bacterium]|nr:hypothetical protein [Micromonosporaceae bacterium]
MTNVYVDDTMNWLADQLHVLEPKDSANGGIYANKPGYHNTRAANQRHWPDNYSIRDALDQLGSAGRAAGLDWTFRSAQRGDHTAISRYCGRLWTASNAGDARLVGWREWFGTCGGQVVQGYDLRYRRPTSSDKSHLWHIHFSETRAYVSSRVNKEALLSVLRGEPLADYLARGGHLISHPRPDPGRLATDGVLGPATIRYWQHVMSTPEDGAISPVSTLVKAVQRHLNAHGATPPLVVDGKGIRQNGRIYQTVRALQHYLGTPEDGWLTPGDSPAVRALQRRLNAGVF